MCLCSALVALRKRIINCSPCRRCVDRVYQPDVWFLQNGSRNAVKFFGGLNLCFLPSAMPPKTRKKSAVNGTAKERIMMKHTSRSLSSLSTKSTSLEEVDLTYKDSRQDKKSKMFQQAAMTGDEETVKTFIFKGLELSITDEFGRTPLHNAILGKQHRIVELLLSGEADVQVKDERGDTPLHTAVRTGDEAVLQMLLQNSKCEVNATGRANVTPLHLAAGMDRVNFCKMLIEHQAIIDSRDEDQMTPMGHAVERGAKDAVEYFFQYASSLNLDMESLLYKADMDESSLLHMAVDSGVLKIVELCLQHGSRVRSPKASDKTTAFHLACEQGSLDIVKLLASHDTTICRITLIDSEGRTPLHRAATNNHVAVVEYLLDQGASVDPPDKARCTPLFKAAANGGIETVQLLLERGADVTFKSVELRSVLHAAVQHSDVMELLLKVPSSAYLITDKNHDNSFTPVHYAAMSGQSTSISLLMATNKAAAIVTSNDLDTPLHIAAKYGWLPIVESLLVGRNVRMINLQNNEGMTPLHLACSSGHDQVAEYLLSQGATIEKDKHQKTALHLAATRGSKRCVMSILAKRPDCLNALDENKDTALNQASFEGHHEIVIHLLSLKEQKVLMNAYNNNLLDIALNREKRNVAMAIAEHERWREAMSSSFPPQ
ncbi:hypothetical protein ACROYT_G037277 [Oculina patagonica]